MTAFCPECGAHVPANGTCRDNLHALLLLEGEVPGGPGTLLHFLAVASYNLQHPLGMNLKSESLEGLRDSLADVLDGRATIDMIRRRVRRAANGRQRVTRRSGDAPVAWHRGAWAMSVTDVIVGGVEGYGGRVTRWARAVREALDEP